MNYKCPKNGCNGDQKNKGVVKNGSFFRPSDGKLVQRYKCKKCGKGFSRATFNKAYRQNKRRMNYKIMNLLCSNMSQRRIAIVLGINKITVARKLQFLAKCAKLSHHKYLQLRRKDKVVDFQFDDLITIEHTKCKPLSVTLAVEVESRKILGFEVSSMPATGHLAAISRKKYGPRQDDRLQGIKNLFEKISPVVDQRAKITSDEHPFYPPKVQEYFPKAKHIKVKGGRASVAGQGELKKLVYDPLFYLNHTCAMLRANINRLIRKTWCTTKKIQGLIDHLSIYIHFHNTQLV